MVAEIPETITVSEWPQVYQTVRSAPRMVLDVLDVRRWLIPHNPQRP